jgi:hypothetical protein
MQKSWDGSDKRNCGNKTAAEEERKSLKKNIVAAGMAIDVMIYNVYLVPPDG